MGYNTVVEINNDMFSDIEEHPEAFVREIHRQMNPFPGEDGTINLPQRYNVGRVVGCYHADMTQLILAGGNTGSLVLTTYGGRGAHNDAEAQLRVLKEWADKLGYQISKKPVKRNKFNHSPIEPLKEGQVP
jgi:hypothetical protein